MEQDLEGLFCCRVQHGGELGVQQSLGHGHLSQSAVAPGSDQHTQERCPVSFHRTLVPGDIQRHAHDTGGVPQGAGHQAISSPALARFRFPHDLRCLFTYITFNLLSAFVQ